MEFQKIEKVKDGRYLKNYELTYKNKAGKEKKYEIVSRRELHSADDIGAKSSGVSIVAFVDHKLLLLKEFRMGVNRNVYNLCAGMVEQGEDMEACISRELFEETGLSVKRILHILPPSFAAVAISDTTTQIAFVEAEGTLSDENTSENELIEPGLYTKNEVRGLIESGYPFSSRAQVAAYFFSIGAFDSL